MTDDLNPSRRGALKCLAFGGAGTLFTLSGGILTPIDLAQAATQKPAGMPLFLQISDTHIGFNKEANPDVAGTLEADHRAGECDADAARADHPYRRHHASVQGGGIRHGHRNCCRT